VTTWARALLALLLCSLAAPAAAAADPPTRIVLQREPGLSAAERADLRADAGATDAAAGPAARTEVLSVPADRARAALAGLRADPDVAWAEPEAVLRATAAAPNDPRFPQLWSFPRMDVLGAWSRSTGAGVTVAVVDTWVDRSHVELAGSVDAGPDFTGSAPVDPSGHGYPHGTHVTGTIVAHRNNGTGIAGIAPDARVLALRALDDAGTGTSTQIARAFDYAAAHARIVSASLGGAGGAGVLGAVIGAHPDTLFVVAAGNDGADNDSAAVSEYPCEVPADNVLCVGASDPSDAPASFSNYGRTTVDLFAPGTGILSTFPGGGYAYADGTSMATPAVAAEAALVLAAAPALSASALKSVLLSSADPVPALQGRSVTGGRADAARALGAAGADADSDGRPDATDDCPAAADPAQADADRDGTGDACDPTPRGSDPDGDGRGALDDACPALAARTATGCPAADADRDGRPDSADGCPSEAARTATGCPVPVLKRLSVQVARGRHFLTVRLAADRAASARVTVERRRCQSRRCRWAPTARRTVRVRTRPVAVTVRSPGGRGLPAGPLRVRAVLSSSAGTARAAVRSVRL
jgi:thermitase